MLLWSTGRQFSSPRIGAVLSVLWLFQYFSFAKAGAASSCSDPNPAVQFDLSAATIVTNNLGGFCGRDELGNECTESGSSCACEGMARQEIRFQNVGTFDSAGFDLVITALDTYRPSTNGEIRKINGVFGGFGLINIQTNTEVRLRFEFQRTGTTNALILPFFDLTLSDLDQGKCTCPLVGINNCDPNCPCKLRQSASVATTDVSQIFLSQSFSALCVEENGNGETVATSNLAGGGEGNPRDPFDMTAEQEANTIGYRVESSSFLDVTINAVHIRRIGQREFGRNIKFAGSSSVTDCSSGETPGFLQGDTFPAIDGQTTNMQSQGNSGPTNVVCGAIQAVLAHPTNANVCLAGATNGGVWRTTSCTAAEPVWEPLTDNEESLSVGDMVYDENDLTRNTVLVGIGGRSSFSQIGGAAIGMLYTTNILDPTPSWQVLDNAAGTLNFRELSVEFNSVFARGNLMLASAFRSEAFFCNEVGIYRSEDSGTTWTNVLFGVGRALASDPNDENIFYASVDFTDGCTDTTAPSNRVFISRDQGATWLPTAAVPDTAPLNQGQLNNAKLSVSVDGSRVWSAILKDGQADSISYSDDQGATWTKMDTVQTQESNGDVEGLNPRVKPGSQGSIHFSLLADPVDKNVIYVGGDRQNNPFPNFIGATDFTGRLFRGDATVTPAGDGVIPSPQWEHMTDSNTVAAISGGGTASSSAPHADTRDMEMRADGSILEGDDGGITIRTVPGSNAGDWFGVCGNIQAFESHNVAYEPVLGSVIFGNQDTGTIFGELGFRDTFFGLLGGDGNDCMIDYKSDSSKIKYYFGTQFYGSFFRLTVDVATFSQDSFDRLFLPLQSEFVSIAAMNPANQMQFAIAAGSFTSTPIMLTGDSGDTFVTDTGANINGAINAMIWSGLGDRLYVAGGSTISICQVTALVLNNCVSLTLANVRYFAVDPMDDTLIFATVAESNGMNPQVFEINTGTRGITDRTVTNSVLDTASLGRSLVFIRNGAVSVLAVGTSNGVLIPDGGLGVGWKVGAPGLPTVAIYDMVYTVEDDTLVVSTLGRGVWFLEQASVVFSGGVSGSFQTGRRLKKRSSHKMKLNLKSLKQMSMNPVPPETSPQNSKIDSTPLVS